MTRWIAGLAAACAALGPHAEAAEVKLGLYKHDVVFLGEGLGLGVGGREKGVDIIGAVYFERPFLKSAGWAPRPYLIGSGNPGPGTDFVGGGLAWKFNFLRRFYFAPEIGLVVHNGETVVRSLSQEEADAVRAQRIEFGSRVLFQPGAHVGLRMTRRLSLELSYVHVSNGEILNGRLFGGDVNVNEGLDLLGARIAWNFGRVKPIPPSRQSR